MPRKFAYLLVSLALVFSAPVLAQDSCHRNCSDDCRVTIPFVGNFVEPQCKLTCEVQNKACIPRIFVPSDTTKIANLAKFDLIVSAAQVSCNAFVSQMPTNEAKILEDAKQAIIDTGLVGADEFNGISIRWCQGDMNASGITISATEIILHKSVKSFPGPTLAHELQHIRQFRRLGSDKFKVDYATYFENCLCQDDRHPFEREAFDFEDKVKVALDKNRRSAAIAVANSLDLDSCSAVSAPWAGYPLYNGNIEGELLGMSGDAVTGWAWDRNKQDVPILVDIYASDERGCSHTFIASVNTRTSIADVKSAPQGYKGFRVNLLNRGLVAGAKYRINVLAHDTRNGLNGSGSIWYTAH